MTKRLSLTFFFLLPPPGKPKISQRTYVVIEEIVDGKVVSRKEEVNSEDLDP